MDTGHNKRHNIQLIGQEKDNPAVSNQAENGHIATMVDDRKLKPGILGVTEGKENGQTT